MSKADKRIPVTEERWEQLHDLKQPGQTYDDLLAALVEEHKKAQLIEDMEQISEESEFTPLDEV